MSLFGPGEESGTFDYFTEATVGKARSSRKDYNASEDDNTLVQGSSLVHFGRGLAANTSDFGKLGDPPTHPELLDWLAGEFVRSGWSLKKLHRLIMTSSTYRQSSEVRSDLAVRDPQNKLLARQSRLRHAPHGAAIDRWSAQ